MICCITAAMWSSLCMSALLCCLRTNPSSSKWLTVRGTLDVRRNITNSVPLWRSCRIPKFRVNWWDSMFQDDITKYLKSWSFQLVCRSCWGGEARIWTFWLWRSRIYEQPPCWPPYWWEPCNSFETGCRYKSGHKESYGLEVDRPASSRFWA